MARHQGLATAGIRPRKPALFRGESRAQPSATSDRHRKRHLSGQLHGINGQARSLDDGTRTLTFSTLTAPAKTANFWYIRAHRWLRTWRSQARRWWSSKSLPQRRTAHFSPIWKTSRPMATSPTWTRENCGRSTASRWIRTNVRIIRPAQPPAVPATTPSRLFPENRPN